MTSKKILILITFFQLSVLGTEYKKTSKKRNRTNQVEYFNDDEIYLPKRTCLQNNDQETLEPICYAYKKYYSSNLESSTNNALMNHEEKNEKLSYFGNMQIDHFTSLDDIELDVDKALYFSNLNFELPLMDSSGDKCKQNNLEYLNAYNKEVAKISCCLEKETEIVSDSSRMASDTSITCDTETVENNTHLDNYTSRDKFNQVPPNDHLNKEESYLQKYDHSIIASGSCCNDIDKTTNAANFCENPLSAEFAEDYFNTQIKSNYVGDTEVQYKDTREIFLTGINSSILNTKESRNSDMLTSKPYNDTLPFSTIDYVPDDSCSSNDFLHHPSCIEHKELKDSSQNNDNNDFGDKDNEDINLLDLAEFVCSALDTQDSEPTQYAQNSTLQDVDGNTGVKDDNPNTQYTVDMLSINNEYNVPNIDQQIQPCTNLLENTNIPHDPNVNIYSGNNSSAHIIEKTTGNYNYPHSKKDTEISTLVKISVNQKKSAEIFNLYNHCINYGLNYIYDYFINMALHDFYMKTIPSLEEMGYKNITAVCTDIASYTFYDKKPKSTRLNELKMMLEMYNQNSNSIEISGNPECIINKDEIQSELKVIKGISIDIYNDTEELKNLNSFKSIEFVKKYYIGFIEQTFYEYDVDLKLQTIKQSLWGINVYMIEFCFYIMWKMQIVTDIVYTENSIIIDHLLDEIQYIKKLIEQYNVICLCEHNNQTLSTELISTVMSFREFISHYLKENLPNSLATTIYYYALNIRHKIINVDNFNIEDKSKVDTNHANSLQTKKSEVFVEKQKSYMINNTIVCENKNARNMMLLTAFTITVTSMNSKKLDAAEKFHKVGRSLSEHFYFNMYNNIYFQQRFIVNIHNVINFIKLVRGSNVSYDRIFYAFPHYKNNYIVYTGSLKYKVLILSNKNALYFYSEHIRSFML